MKKIFSITFLITLFFAAESFSEQVKKELPCQDEISEECVRGYLSNNLVMPTGKRAYPWALAEKLAKAGLYAQAVNVVERDINNGGTTGLSDLPLKYVVITQIVEEANANPDKIANLDLIDSLANPSNELGRLIRAHSNIKEMTYSTLGFLLSGAIGEHGYMNVVRYHEMAANTNFNSNATWNEFIKRWDKLAKESSEPERSHIYIRIAESLYNAGDYDSSKEYLDKVIDLKRASPIGAQRLARRLGQFDKAIDFVKEEYAPSYYKAMGAKAEHLIENQNSAEALLLLDNMFEIIKSNKSKMGRTDGLVLLAELYYKAGDENKALNVAKWTEDYIRNDKGSFSLGFQKMPMAYRLAGDAEKAKELISTKIGYQKNKCGPVTDEMKGFFALEFYNQKMIPEAFQTLQGICDEEDKINVWMAMYESNYRINATGLSVERFKSSIQPYLHTDLYNSLASFYYLNNDKEQGNLFLNEAFKAAPETIGTKPLCDAAVTAYFAGRDDLLKHSFELGYMGLYNINKPIKEKKVTPSFLNWFLAPKKEPINNMEFEIYNNLANLARCHYQIAISKY